MNGFQFNGLGNDGSQGLTPYAVAFLRISLGIMFVAHSVILKYFVYTLAGTAGYFESIGLPGFLAYVVFWMEFIGGLLLILGIGSRWVSLALLPILVGAFWAHAGFGWVFSNENGGWEYPLYLCILAVVQIMLGDGALSLGRAGFLFGSGESKDGEDFRGVLTQ
ncbi:MAG: DoxX family protein [Xanthomonadales bacterium]|nr:DoxX family protein [Xanthomonadales bacterium]